MVLASGVTLDTALSLVLRNEGLEVFPVLLSPSLEGENKGITRSAAVASALEYPGSFPSGPLLLWG